MNQLTLPLPEPEPETPDMPCHITYMAPPYAARHPAPPVVDATLAPWEEETR